MSVFLQQSNVIVCAKYKEAVMIIGSGVMQQKFFASQRFAKSVECQYQQLSMEPQLVHLLVFVSVPQFVAASDTGIIATAAALKFVCVSRIIRRGASFDVAARCRSCAALDFASLSNGSGTRVCSFTTFTLRLGITCMRPLQLLTVQRQDSLPLTKSPSLRCANPCNKIWVSGKTSLGQNIPRIKHPSDETSLGLIK